MAARDIESSLALQYQVQADQAAMLALAVHLGGEDDDVDGGSDLGFLMIEGCNMVNITHGCRNYRTRMFHHLRGT